MPLQLTTRDRELLVLLTHRLRVLSVPQIARTWYGESELDRRAARRRVTVLTRAAYLAGQLAMVHPELSLTAPVLYWQPGDPAPDFGGVSARLRGRWRRVRIGTPIVWAGTAAMRRFGGYVGGRGPRRSEATHDVHLAAVFLHFRANRPAWAKRWVSEQEQYARGGGRNARLPDAVIAARSRAHGRDIVIEFGGAYSKAKLEEFHAALREYPYEIW